MTCFGLKMDFGEEELTLKEKLTQGHETAKFLINLTKAKFPRGPRANFRTENIC